MMNPQIITIDPGLAITTATPSLMETDTITNLPSPPGPNTLRFDSFLTQATDPPTLGMEATNTITQGGPGSTETNSTDPMADKNFSYPSSPNDGPFTKTCTELGMGGNLAAAAEVTMLMLQDWLSQDAGHTPNMVLKLLEDQPAPFPLLAIKATSMVVLHSLK